MSPVFEMKTSGYLFQTFTEKPKLNLLTIDQIHGNDVVSSNSYHKTADGIWTSRNSDEALAIQTADCLPVAYIGEKGIALVHAGWRGLRSGILEAPALFDIKPKTIIIGPAISMKNYEVGAEFHQFFPNSDNLKTIKDKLFFNLKAQARDQLAVNWPTSQIEVCDLDTFTHPELHSYRQNQTEKRNWHILKKTI